MRLEDRVEILDLMSNLAYMNDSINEEGYRNLYVKDCLRSMSFREGEPRYTEGREECTRMEHVKMLKEHGILEKHYYTNPVLQQVSDSMVKGKVSILVLHQHLEEMSPKLASFGVCDLVFRKTVDGWKIAEFHVHLQMPDPFTHGEEGIVNR